MEPHQTHLNLNLCSNQALQRNLQCSLCEKTLSIPPINHSDMLGPICGRCFVHHSAADLGNLVRQHVFESLAELMIFPCENQATGCAAQIEWNNVQQHETACPFRPIPCPLLATNVVPDDEHLCLWKGPAGRLNEHILNSHEDRFVCDLESVHFIDTAAKLLIFNGSEDDLYGVKFVCGKPSSMYFVSAMVNGGVVDCKNYHLDVVVMSAIDQNDSVTFRQSTCNNFFDFCEDKKQMLEIDLLLLAKVLKCSTNDIRATFQISKQETGILSGAKNDQTVATSQSIVAQSLMKTKLLTELECPVCKEYFMSPIFVCKTGHSICSDCHTHVAMCPTCKEPYNATRNFSLESLMAEIDYPCSYRSLGCGAVLQIDTIQAHERDCKFVGHECILQCHKRVLNMTEHIEDEHLALLIEPNTIQHLKLDNGNLVSNAICYEGTLFGLYVKSRASRKSVLFAVKQFGKDVLYRYHLKLFDIVQNKSIELTDFCKPYNGPFSIDAKNDICLGHEILDQFHYGRYFIYYMIYFDKANG